MSGQNRTEVENNARFWNETEAFTKLQASEAWKPVNSSKVYVDKVCDLISVGRPRWQTSKFTPHLVSPFANGSRLTSSLDQNACFVDLLRGKHFSDVPVDGNFQVEFGRCVACLAYIDIRIVQTQQQLYDSPPQKPSVSSYSHERDGNNSIRTSWVLVLEGCKSL